MPAGSFIRYLPSAASGDPRVPVTVVEADVTDAELWDRDIQQPWIAKTNRIDASWRWRTNYLRAALIERSLGRELAYLQLQTAAADGDVFPIGQIP